MSILVSPERGALLGPGHDARASSRTNGGGRMSVWRGGALRESGRIGILVHGCHLQADGWESIVWGDPPHQLGRLPHAALLAWEERESLRCVCFGTGASQTAVGELEGAYTLRILLERLPRLAEFSAIREAGVPLDELGRLLRRVAVAEVVSQNTVQEVREGLTRFAAAGCKRAVLVSSPTHLPRCLACACNVMEQDAELFEGSLWASPSDTSYQDSTAADVVVVEPPHRGDRDRDLDALPFHAMVKRSYKIGGDARARFLSRFDALLLEFGA